MLFNFALVKVEILILGLFKPKMNTGINNSNIEGRVKIQLNKLLPINNNPELLPKRLNDTNGR